MPLVGLICNGARPNTFHKSILRKTDRTRTLHEIIRCIRFLSALWKSIVDLSSRIYGELPCWPDVLRSIEKIRSEAFRVHRIEFERCFAPSPPVQSSNNSRGRASWKVVGEHQHCATLHSSICTITCTILLSDVHWLLLLGRPTTAAMRNAG